MEQLVANKGAGAACAGIFSCFSALISGFDPFPWVLATFGMVYMLSNLEPDPKKTPNQLRGKALGNGIVSLVFGGLGGPWLAVFVAEYINKNLSNPLLMSFILSAFWQAFAYRAWPTIWPIIRRRIDAGERKGVE